MIQRNKTIPLFILGLGSMFYIALLSYFLTTINLSSYLGLILPFLLVLFFLICQKYHRFLFPLIVISILCANLIFSILIILNRDGY